MCGRFTFLLSLHTVPYSCLVARLILCVDTCMDVASTNSLTFEVQLSILKLEIVLYISSRSINTAVK